MSVMNRLVTSLYLLSQIGQILQIFRRRELSKKNTDGEYVPPELSSIYDIIRRFFHNNQTMTDAELREITEELANKWEWCLSTPRRYDFTYYAHTEVLLELSLKLFGEFEEIIRDYDDNSNSWLSMETIIKLFLGNLVTMEFFELQTLVLCTLANLKSKLCLKTVGPDVLTWK